MLEGREPRPFGLLPKGGVTVGNLKVSETGVGGFVRCILETARTEFCPHRAKPARVWRGKNEQLRRTH